VSHRLVLAALVALIPACDSGGGGPLGDDADAARTPTDAGAPDAGPVGDGAPPLVADGGPPNEGPPDLGPPDVGPPDAGQPDASPPSPAPCGEARVREPLSIPMRDGESLAAFLERPAQAGCPQPIVFIQTPYNMEGVYSMAFGEERASRPLFASPHYSFVAMDWRGRFANRGVPGANVPGKLKEDSFDAVEWLAAQPFSDGNIGTIGVSALCGAQ
jgi:hypothetical protein